MSAQLIESHYEHDYGGAVQRLNAIDEEIEALEAPGATFGYSQAQTRRARSTQFDAAP